MGREALIDRVAGFLRTAATSRNRPHVLLVGPRGSGKTHALAVVLHQAQKDPEIAARLAIVWVPEDAVGLTSYADLLVATVEHLLDGAPGDQASKQGTLDFARLRRAARDELALEGLVRELRADRVLVLVLENLDRIFEELGERGQARLRAFTETTGEVLVLASTPLLFDAVSERKRPWFGSFRVEHLGELSVEEGSVLLARVAVESDDPDLAAFLRTKEARARIRAVADLAGGSPRMWMVLAGCMTIELLDELAPLVETMLDQLAPYYQQRLWELPSIERKLVVELCRTATVSRAGRVVHEQRGMRTVADLATACGVDPRVAATALGRLNEVRWVRRSKQRGTDRRTTWYEIREPLLRHFLQFRETRGEPLRVIVGFLRAWYAPQERRRWLAAADAGSLSEQYLRRTVSAELRAVHSLYVAASPEDLIWGARCLLDDEDAYESAFGMRNVSAGIVAEAVALDAWRSRAQAVHAARSRLAQLEPAAREVVAEVLATALSAVGDPLAAADVLAPSGPPPQGSAVQASRDTLARVQANIARALNAAVSAADGRMQLRDRVTMRLLAAGWMGASGDPAHACELLERSVGLADELDRADRDLRLAIDGERAYFLFESGRRDEGRSLCERVLSARADALGADHPDTLMSRSNLAYFAGEEGHWSAARDLYATVVNDRKRVLGADHPGTLGSRHRYAYYVGQAGDRVAARDLHESVVEDRRRVLGPEHPRTLASRHMHARLVGETGDPARARDLLAALVTDRVNVLGAEHPDTLTSRHEHAHYLGKAGDHVGAREAFAALVPDRERILGPEDPDTLASRVQHAYHVSLTRGPEAASALAAIVFEHAFRALGLHEPTAWKSRVLADAGGRDEPVRSVVVGEAGRLQSVAEAVLRLDSALATQLLTAWCDATSRVEAPLLQRAVARVIEVADRADRMTELGAAVIRALATIDEAQRAPWIVEWLSASATRDELAVTYRILSAASAALRGDPTAMLALAVEEQRIGGQVLAAMDPRPAGDAPP